ncbi:MAG TPA: hypothetical protein VK809_07420 [Bacteroidia bacterium]|jgi:hypothetical protein|nr:hypothetical protein [Bacteroidia bacterium]
MKTYLFLFGFCTFGFWKDPIDKLIGTWKLEKVDFKNTTLLPDTICGRFLVISKSQILYDTDGGYSGKSSKFSITDKTISYGQISYTKMLFACHDSLSSHIDYNGKYELHDSLLVVTNDKGKHYLIKQ